MKDFINLDNIGNPEVLENITNWSEIKNHVKIRNEKGDNGFIHGKRTYLTLGITTAVELSYLRKDAQKLVYYTIGYEAATPSYTQALRIRKLAEKNKLKILKT